MSTGVLQNAPAFIIIVLAVAGIGALPYGVHRLYYGEERRVGLDNWDRSMIERDRRLREEFKKKKLA